MEYEVTEIKEKSKGIFKLKVNPLNDDENPTVKLIFNFVDNIFKAELDNGESNTIDPTRLKVASEGKDSDLMDTLNDLVNYIEDYKKN